MRAVGFLNEQGSKMASCYCFRAVPDLGIRIAACRFFCNCKGCKKRLSLPSDKRYDGIGKECKFWPIFKREENRGWNQIHLLRFEPAKGYDEDNHDEMISQTVDGIATINARCIVVGGYGGYAVDNGQFWYYMVKCV